MIICETREELTNWRNNQLEVSLVPTMGALHDGHLSLIQEAKKHRGRSLVSIFVNPKQFGPNEDFDQYPRTLDADLKKCEDEGVDCVWIPKERGIYPEGVENAIGITVPDSLSKVLCGVSRPHFFDGVCTVVYRLLILSKATTAIFGEKDFQQLIILKKMVSDLMIPVTISGCPIVRETDGLAMSSRNRYLSSKERHNAATLYQALLTAKKELSEGINDISVIRSRLQSNCPQLTLDYLECVDHDTLELKQTCKNGDRLCVAAWCGQTRLIDNLMI